MKKQNKRILKKNNNKKKIQFALLLCVIVLISYVLYVTINLVIKPVDVVLVEEGKIYSEETTVGYILRDEVVISRRKL